MKCFTHIILMSRTSKNTYLKVKNKDVMNVVENERDRSTLCTSI